MKAKVIEDLNAHECMQILLFRNNIVTKLNRKKDQKSIAYSYIGKQCMFMNLHLVL